MKWISVESLEELKSLGKFTEVKLQIKQDVGENIKITGRSWNDVYNNILNFRNIIKSINQPQPTTQKDEEYFTSKSNEYIFYLTELDGEVRMKKLGINKSHFSDKKKAKKWRDKISKNIHPDINHHPKSHLAMIKLNDIYSSMVGKED